MLSRRISDCAMPLFDDPAENIEPKGSASVKESNTPPKSSQQYVDDLFIEVCFCCESILLAQTIYQCEGRRNVSYAAGLAHT